MNIVQLLELVRHHARQPERPQVGKPPARLTYFTVECADGKRSVAYDSTKRGRVVRGDRPPDHRGRLDDRRTA